VTVRGAHPTFCFSACSSSRCCTREGQEIPPVGLASVLQSQGITDADEAASPFQAQLVFIPDGDVDLLVQPKLAPSGGLA